jgi:PhnB protein
MRWNPHLTFDGQCEVAFKYYEKCLGAKILMMMTHEDSPMAKEFPLGWGTKILHATIALGEQVVTGGDAPPEQYKRIEGFAMLLSVDDTAEADRIFAAMVENGTEQMPLQETFWAKRFGMLIDQFGVPWMINCGTPE